jgi:norsolorinic acid ketoreductase
MSSGAGVIDRVPDKPDAAYGITKFQLNYLARWGHFENPEIVVLALSPGWVQT